MTHLDENYSKQGLYDVIRTKWAGRQISFYEEIDSTNVRARIEAENGAKHGSLVVADRQTAGLGRRGRSWTSPVGTNVAMTIILKPEISPEKAPMLTLVMAVAVAYGMERAIRKSEYGRQRMNDAGEMSSEKTAGKSGIKWPNDIVVNGKKVCGILTEMGMDRNSIKYVMIGVGINVGRQEFAPELADKATSIESECGCRFSRAAFIAEILSAFEKAYEEFIRTGDLSGLRESYEGLLVNKGQEVNVLDPNGDYRGTALGITDTGELRVRLADGSVENVYAGEVSVRGIYGYV